MARYDNHWEAYEYTPVYQKQDMARRSQSRLAKTHGALQPVQLTGRALASSWWGQAWNANLERYSDYANRLPRGRTYLRGGMVLHLAIEPGKVAALVQGSRPKPYEVTVTVAALKPAAWARAKASCAGRLDSLQALLAGQFPESLKDLFLAAGGGLFPAPAEIQFDCTCPDWASMCKHVAAVLYGIGARLDADPGLFFTLRQVSVDDLVAKALKGTTEILLDRAGQAAAHALATADLGGVFGIDIDDAPAAAPPAAKPTTTPARPKPRGNARTAKDAAATGAAAGAKAAAPAAGAASPGQTRQPKAKTRTSPARPAPATRPLVLSARLPAMLKRLLAALQKQPAGMTVRALMASTGFTETQTRNAVARARAQGLLTSPRGGVYAPVGRGRPGR